MNVTVEPGATVLPEGGVVVTVTVTGAPVVAAADGLVVVGTSNPAMTVTPMRRVDARPR